MSLKQLAGAIAALAAGASMALPAPGPMHARSIVAGRTIPQYQHIFLIMMENHSYGQIIGNPSAPQINRLAREYGLATNYFGVAHPSEPNYVATIGGSYFGIQNDAPYTQHTIAAPSLVDQLTAARLTWTSYQQSLGGTGYTGTVYPSSSNPLYASKHDPFLNFAGVQHNPAQLRHIVPDTQLQADLAHGSAPNFSYIVPDQCHDMHGSPACAGDSAQSLIGKGDSYAGTAVSMIMRSSIWSRGNNAIVITWDEDDSAASPAPGCCDANPGGGHVATIVISSHGVRGVRDATAYNHYSLLQTIEAAFGLGCLQHTCDTVHVTPMALLFRGERSLAMRGGRWLHGLPAWWRIIGCRCLVFGGSRVNQYSRGRRYTASGWFPHVVDDRHDDKYYNHYHHRNDPPNRGRSPHACILSLSCGARWLRMDASGRCRPHCTPSCRAVRAGPSQHQ